MNFFLLTTTDTLTSRNTDLSSWIILYNDDSFSRNLVWTQLILQLSHRCAFYFTRINNMTAVGVQSETELTVVSLATGSWKWCVVKQIFEKCSTFLIFFMCVLKNKHLTSSRPICNRALTTCLISIKLCTDVFQTTFLLVQLRPF
jgi:hypothetical protein